MNTRRRWRRLFGAEPEGDVDHELSFHLDMRVRELMAQGVSEENARRAAQHRFGDYQGSRRACIEIDARRRRKMTVADYLGVLRQDVTYALRMLRRAPTFTIVAVLTLGLGIGANAAIFSVVNGVVLQSLPYAEADRLYRVRTLYPDGQAYSVSPPDFMSLRQDASALEQVEAYGTGAFTLTGLGDPSEVMAVQVSDGLFPMLGLRLSAGRAFLRDDHEPGRPPVIVLDHGYWQRQFGGGDVLGRTLTLAGRSGTIVGIVAPGVTLPARADIYIPIEYGETFSASTATGRRGEFLAVLARATQGASAEQVEQDLRRVGAALQSAFPTTNANQTFTAIPLQDFIVGTTRTPLLVLLGAVAFVLLVACANVANLLLARASARHDEMAVRAALGAARGRLYRQLFTEAIVLGLIGGAAGLAIAFGATRAIVSAQPGDLPRLDEIAVNGPVLWFTLVISLVTSLLFGAIPAAQGLGRSLTQTLRQGGRGGGVGRSGQRARSLLVIAEMALAVVLLTGAGLLIRSFVQLTQPPPGVRLDKGMTFRLALQGSAYPDGARIRQAVDTIEARLRALPGVERVASTTVLPLSGRGNMVGFTVEGGPPVPPDVNAEISIASATPGYFEAIGATVRSGRVFTELDRADAPAVVVINEAGVRRWFQGREAVGRFVLVNGRRCEVIGVVADVPQRNRSEAVVPALFAPYSQRTSRTIRVVLTTATAGMSPLADVRAAITAIDPGLAIVSPMPLSQLADDSVAGPRFYTSLLTLFAGVALALAATGIFGVMSYTVAQRTREIGIRMALGASAPSVLRMVLAKALVMTTIGAVVGVAAALGLGRFLQGQLYGVALIDPITIVGVIGALTLAAVIAVVVPARRASNVDPAIALRQS